MRKHFLVQKLLLQTSGSDPQLSPLGLQTHERFGLTLEQMLYERHLRPEELQELLEGRKISVVSEALKEQSGRTDTCCLRRAAWARPRL